MLVEIHGWDARERQWHAPAILEHSLKGCGTLARKMRQFSGSWHGKLSADIPGEPRLSFFACVHDLGDCGLGALDLDGMDGGPLQFVLAVPAHRRGSTRDELAFEFTSYVRFLEGAQSRGSEMALHDYIEQALRAPGSGHLVFSVESRPLLPEMQLLVSQQAERLAMGIVAGLEARDCPPSFAAAAD